MLYNSAKTVAVIVTYNRLNLLKECINALINSIDPTDILIVNNCSNDGTKEYIDNLKDDKIKFYIHNLPSNLNGSGGYNYGIKEAIKLNYDYLWIMDDDCIVKENSLSELYKVCNELKGNFGFLASKVLWKDGSICKTNVQRRAVARKVKDFNSHIYRVDYTSFVSCFVKKDDVLNIGLPIKDFVIWTDDLEWTRRLTFKKINKFAKPGYLCNDSIVIHKSEKNIGVSIIKDSDERFYRYSYIYRNDVFCFRKEGIRGHLYLFFRNMYHILTILLFAKSKKIERIKVLLSGYINGYKFKPIIELC